MQIYLIFALIFAIIVALFAIQNTTIVTIQFIIWQAELSLVLVILGSVAAGALLLFFLNLMKQYSNHREKKNLKQENERLVKEIKALEEAQKAVNETTTEACNQDNIETNPAVEQVQDGHNA